MKLYGIGKEALSVVTKKALDERVTRVLKAIKVVRLIGDPVEAIYGMLSHVKKSGVELQHEARRIRAEKSAS